MMYCRETQYLGDTVLIISPDSANLSILQVSQHVAAGVKPATGFTL